MNVANESPHSVMISSPTPGDAAPVGGEFGSFEVLPRASTTPIFLFANGSVAQNFDNLPTKMRDAKRWLLWKSVPNSNPEKKPLKIPFYLDGLPRGKTDDDCDRAKLGTFAEALARLKAGGFTGLGFALGPDGTGNYWQGIDLDDVEANRLQELANSLPGYVELSPNSKGCHAIGYGERFAALGSNATGVEAYCEGRFFTVTGQAVRGSL